MKKTAPRGGPRILKYNSFPFGVKLIPCSLKEVDIIPGANTSAFKPGGFCPR
jgi:hypothetical protein